MKSKIKKQIITTIFLLFVSMLLCLSASSNASILKKISINYLSSSCQQGLLNDILYVGDNSLGSYDTIQEALNAAKDGDTIYVYDDSSPYKEQIIIGKSIILKGENAETTIIDGGGSGTVVFIKADNVNLSGFTITNSGTSHPSAGVTVNADDTSLLDIHVTSSYYGVRFEYSHRNILSNASIFNVIESGVSLYESTEIVIDNSMISNTKNGIELSHTSNYNTIYATALLDCETGLMLSDASQNVVYWNTITNNGQGIYLEGSDENEIFNENIITDNTIGISLLNSDDNEIYDKNMISENTVGLQLYSSSGNNIHENLLEINDYGIRINKSSNNDVYWNDIFENSYGVYLLKSNGNQIYLNNLKDNHHFAVYLSFCKQTKIAYNNFFENYISASFEQSLFSRNTWKKNYWDDWSGKGSYKIEGKLESVFSVPSWTSTDYQPASSPYDI